MVFLSAGHSTQLLPENIRALHRLSPASTIASPRGVLVYGLLGPKFDFVGVSNAWEYVSLIRAEITAADNVAPRIQRAKQELPVIQLSENLNQSKNAGQKTTVDCTLHPSVRLLEHELRLKL